MTVEVNSRSVSVMITYRSLERLPQGYYMDKDGNRVQMYRWTAGPTVRGSVWSPGPVPGSVWVLPADDSTPVVVRVDKRGMSQGMPTQVEYSFPDLSILDNEPNPADVAKALEIRSVARALRKSRYSYSRQPVPKAAEPSAAEVAWANEIGDRARRCADLREELRAASHAPRPISDKRFRDLALM